MKTVRRTLIFLAFSLGMLIAQNGVQRTIVQRGDISVPGREAVVVRIEIAPGGSTGRHTHSGDESDYVLEGQLEVTIDGQEPKIVKAGEAIVIPAGAVHNAQNKGSEPLKAVGVYIVEGQADDDGQLAEVDRCSIRGIFARYEPLGCVRGAIPI
jgi:quercetin dioxygenase-like cupin family protein